MLLTDLQCRTAKPAEKVRRLFDPDGLFLEVTPSGGQTLTLKLFKYRLDGKAPHPRLLPRNQTIQMAVMNLVHYNPHPHKLSVP